MKIGKLILGFFFVLLLLPFVLAEEDDIEVFGVELEKILNLFGGLLALGLAIVTGAAYSKTNNSRLKYVFLAFLLFATKEFLAGSELFFGDFSWIDPTKVFLEFAVLLSFFYGIVKR